MLGMNASITTSGSPYSRDAASIPRSTQTENLGLTKFYLGISLIAVLPRNFSVVSVIRRMQRIQLPTAVSIAAAAELTGLEVSARVVQRNKRR